MIIMQKKTYCGASFFVFTKLFGIAERNIIGFGTGTDYLMLS